MFYQLYISNTMKHLCSVKSRFCRGSSETFLKNWIVIIRKENSIVKKGSLPGCHLGKEEGIRVLAKLRAR